MLKRPIKMLLKAALGLFALIFVFLLFERVRGQFSLASYKRELIAKGEKLTFSELIPPVPEGENGAPEVVRAAEQLQQGAVLPHNLPRAMIVRPSGRAVIGFRENEWVETGTYRDGKWRNEKVTNRWEQLALDLKTNAAALAQIRAALQKPVLRNTLDYTNPIPALVDYLGAAKRAAQWLFAASQLDLHKARLTDAADNLVALVRLQRLLAEDRLMSRELVRFAIASIATAATWEALQADGWSDADLTRLQQAWQAEDFLTSMARSLESERVFGLDVFEQLRRSNNEVVELLAFQDAGARVIESVVFERPPSDTAAGPPWWRATRPALVVYSFIWRFAWLDQNKHRYHEQMQRLIQSARKAAADNSRIHVQTVLAQIDAHTQNKSFYNRLRCPDPVSVATIAHAFKHAFRAQTERALAICAIALKRYELRHGKLPASLEALVPEFLPSVPTDCMDGKPVKYRLGTNGGFVLYSVGEDGTDDGGDASPLPGKKSSSRLWDRRDFVWPAPALPDEIWAYRNEAMN